MTKEELVNLCKEGDERALSLLYKTYAEKMKRICSQYVSDKQTVNDLPHDGFIIKSHCAMVPQRPSRNKKQWSSAFSYSGINKPTKTQKTIISGDASSEKPQEAVKESYHHIPIVLSLSVNKRTSERWGLETGFQYTRLHSDFTAVTDFHLKETQKINHIGIPLKGTFTVHGKQRLSVCLSAGITLDIPVKATSESIASDESGQITFFEKSDIHPSLQWSTN